MEVDDVFDREVSRLSSFQAVGQQAQEQEPGQGGARFHGRPKCHSCRRPGSGDAHLKQEDKCMSVSSSRQLGLVGTLA